MAEKSPFITILQAAEPAQLLYVADVGMLRRERFVKKYIEGFFSDSEVIQLDGRFFGDRELQEYQSAVRSLSLFSTKKLIHIKYADSLLAGILAQLSADFATCSLSTYILFSGGPLPERSLFKKSIEKYGTYNLFGEIKGPELRRWIKKECAHWNIVSIEDAAVELVIELCGNSLDEAQKIIERVGLFSDDGKITRSTVLALFSRSLSNTEFECVDAIILEDRRKASILQNQLFKEGLNPYGFIPLAAKSIFNIAAFFAAQAEGYSFERIKAAFGLSPWIANKLSQSMKKTTPVKNQALAGRLLEAEFRLKSKSISHVDIVESVLDTQMHS